MARAGKKQKRGKPQAKPAGKKTAPAKRAAATGNSRARKKVAAKSARTKNTKPTKQRTGKTGAKTADSRKTTIRKRADAKPTKTSTPAPTYVRSGQRRPTDVVRVRARFTEPLRRFSPYENLRDLIQGQADKYEDRTFLIYEDDGREYSYRALDRQTTAVANVLHELGFGKGARVALLLENSPEFAFAFLGAMKGGFIAVPMNLQLADEQLRFMLEDCGAGTVITSSAVWQRIAPLLESLPGLEAVLLVDRPGAGSGISVEPNHTGKPGNGPYRIMDFTGCLSAAKPELQTATLGWWDEAQIVYTGHHLDQPRGAILQHRQFMTSARWLAIWLNLDAQQRFMSVLPLFHANAQIVTLFTPLQIGGSVVLSKEFSVARVWRAVERYRVSTLSAVPAMLGILADRELAEARGAKPPGPASWPSPQESPGTLCQRNDVEAREAGLARAHDISSLERVLCGAAPLPSEVQKRFEQTFLVPVIEGYSMAETTCFAMLNPGNGTRKLGSVGVGVGNKVAIQNNSMPPRPLEGDWGPMSLPRMNPAVFPTAEVYEPGEICVWGENVLKEYYHRPQDNPESFAGGWFHTGDIGYQDAEGFFYVLGNKNEQVELDGERFMPREVDEQLFAHGQVEHAATVALEATGGSTVTTWVVMRKGTFPGGPDEGRMPADEQQLDAKRDEITAFLAQRLVAKKCPASIQFARKLPTDATGKTRILELKRLADRRAVLPE